MQTDNRLADDLAKVAASAVGVIAGVKDEFEGRLRQVFERMLDDMELVNRDEFKAMAAKARAENERLAARIAALEGTGETAPKPRKRPAKSARKT